MLCFFACFFKAYVLSKSLQGGTFLASRLPIPLSVVFAQVTFPLENKKKEFISVCLPLGDS